jgi:hypothetical protein
MIYSITSSVAAGGKIVAAHTLSSDIMAFFLSLFL